MAGVHWSAQLANIIAQQQAGLQVKPSIGSMQQVQRMYQPSQGVRQPVIAPPKQTQKGNRQGFPSATPTAPANTLAGSLMLKEADRGTTNPSADALARRALEKRAMGVEGEYAKEQQQLAQQAAEEQKRLAQAAAQKLGDDAYYTVMELTGGDKKIASEVAQIMTSDPQAGRSIIQQIAEQKYDTSKAPVTNIFSPPPAGYRYADETRTKLIPIEGGEPWRKIQEEKEKAIGRDIEQNQTSQLITQQVSAIRDTIKDNWMPTTGLGGAVTRMVTGALSPRPVEGEVPLLESFTGAGEVTRRNEVIKNNIGLAAINNMREFSPSGGALGNVSNFEVRMVQNVKDALDTTRGKEEYLTALDTVEKLQKRAVYFRRHGKDMAAKAEELGLRPEVFIVDMLNKQFPIDAEFTQNILDEETGWDSLEPLDLNQEAFDSGEIGEVRDTTAPQTGGWSIKPVGTR